jgi:hypothetical protein
MNESKIQDAGNAPLTQPADTFRDLWRFIVAAVLAWTLFLIIARWQGALWDDMLETWAWARQPQLGYYKHPPFYAWVVALWFKVFPRVDAAFYLLSMVNAGVGFAGVYALGCRFVAPRTALAAVLLYSLTPWTTYMASNFNANTVLLSIWPWTAYAFVRSLDPGAARARALWGVLFGTLAAAGLLSKYSSVLLLASCFIASLLHPDVRAYYRSPAPYLAVAMCVVLCLPHAWWAVANDVPPIRYAMGKTASPPGRNVYKAVTTGLASLAMGAGAIIALGAALQWDRRLLRSVLGRLLPGRLQTDRTRLWIWLLAMGPFLLTVGLGLTGALEIATNFMIPAFFMAPVLLVMGLAAIDVDGDRLAARLGRIAQGVLLAAVLAAPMFGAISMRTNIKGTADPTPQVARLATQLWHAAFDSPVRIANGSEKFSIAMPFYSPDNPAEFTHFDFGQAPWVSPARIAAEGLLTICFKADQGCRDLAAKFTNNRSRTIEHQISHAAWGFSRTIDVVFIMTPGTVTKSAP